MDFNVVKLNLGVARVTVVVSPEVANRRKYRLDGNDHVNNFNLECYSVRSRGQCSARVISTYVVT